MKITCPKCNTEIEMKNPITVAGGKKSRRKLTPEQARKMVEARERKKIKWVK